MIAVACVAFFAGAANALAAPSKVAIDPTATGKFNTAVVSGEFETGEHGAYFTFEVSSDGGANWSGFNYEGFLEANPGVQKIPAREIGVQPNTEYEVRLVAMDAETGEQAISPGPNPKFKTKPVNAPAVTFPEPIATTGTTAHFSITIDPEADPTNDHAFDVAWYVECTPECPNMPYEIIPADSEPHHYELDAKDLIPGTKYQATLYTFNAGGTFTTNRTFTTKALPPTVRTGVAHVAQTSATIAGSINPNGAETTYYFEWGEGFAQKTPTKSLFAGSEVVAVTAPLSGLTPGATYPFRLVATNSEGTVKSDDKTFTTPLETPETCSNSQFRVGPSAALPDCRAYELVNPPTTDWSDIVRVWPGSDDGNHISYLTLVPPEIAESAVVASSFISSRTPTGWTTKDVNLRVKYVYGLDVSLPACFSSDYTHAIIDSPATIDSNDQDGGAHDYARIEVGDPFGEPLTYGATLPDKLRGFPPTYLGGSPDLSRIEFWIESIPLSPETPESGNAIYMRDAAGLHVISRDTENNVLPEVRPIEGNCPTRQTASRNASSADGSKVFYAPGYGGGTIYRNDLDTGKVIAVTHSHKTGDTSNPGSGGFQYATPDGNVVYFTSGEQLTDNGTEFGGLYRYEASTDTLEQLTPDLGEHANFGFEGSAYGADNDARLFFTSQRRLTPGAPRNPTKIYVWERGDEGGTPGPGGPGKGTTRLITSITDGTINRVSANGRYMLFQSHNSIDGANNRGKNAIYMYDAVSRDIACVSCRPNGGGSTRDSSLSDEPESLTFGIINPRNVTNDGRVFFNSSDKLIPADQTTSQDVYEYFKGRVFLITSGQGDENPSYLADNSDDGSHVFVLSRSAFRPEDKDSAELDVYDAHIDGGFPLPKPVPPICEGEACRTATSPKPEDAAPTTPNFSGPPNPRAKREKQKRHHHKKKHHKKKHHKQSQGSKGGKR